ncbi:hypothetical protein CFIO01_11752 [Colletotrichum fioriniae PJ7]|uniref:Uncharacterized protein n=1 Tax=Colletotrichum fioriniae PJ7 TaxID=1445577 RepID=A0A010Q018_9PEZI|nr:hypothetical protein CFIO01_11752 [Colletotrichum fioriniae PJ7]
MPALRGLVEKFQRIIDVDSEAWENILAERNRLEDWHQYGDVKEMCFMSLAEPYGVFIEFAPDDPPGLLQKWGSDLIEIVALLLGTRDFAPEKGAYGTIGGLSNPVKMSRKSPDERENDEVSDEDTAVVAIPPACELPSELVEAFVEDTEYPRFTTFLSRNDIGVAKALISSSAKETVTIIQGKSNRKIHRRKNLKRMDTKSASAASIPGVNQWVIAIGLLVTWQGCRLNGTIVVAASTI